MLRIVVAGLFVAGCWKWGDWKHYWKYYPTILYFIIWDLIYNFIFHDYTLWKLTGFINHTFSVFIVAFIIYPCTVLMYLPYFPEKRIKQFIQFAFWVTLYSLIEVIAQSTNNIKYEHGWNFTYSVGINIIIFLMLRMHYKKPLIAWPISIAWAALIMFLFKIPFNLIK